MGHFLRVSCHIIRRTDYDHVQWAQFFVNLSPHNRYVFSENTSYSAMLNIVESVPPPEPVPSNSGNSVIIQYNRSTRHWPSSIKFPEFRNRMKFSEFWAIRSDSVSIQFPEFRAGITSRPHPHAYCCDRRLVSGISNSGYWFEFHTIPEFCLD
jgi:hypothetical protein